MGRFFQILAKLVGVLVVLGVPAALAYLHWVGFDPGQRERVADAIGGSVLAVDIGRLTFNPFQGIVAEDVAVSQRAGARQRLAEIDRLVVSMSLADLLRGRISIDLLNLEHATVSIPFAEDGRKPDVVELSNLHAEIHHAGGRLTISAAEFDLHGVRVSLTGELLNPEAAVVDSAAPPENPEARVAAIRSALGVLEEMKFSEGGPRLALRLTGNLSDLDTLAVPQIELRCGGLEYRELAFADIGLSGSYANRMLTVRRLDVEGATADAKLSGGWDFARREGEASVAGRLAADAILRFAGREDLADAVAFDRPPEIDARLTGTAGTEGFSALVTGRVATGPFSVKGVGIKDLRAAFAWRDSKFYVQDAVIEAETGTVRASAMQTDDGFRMKLDSDAIPTEFSALFGPNERKILDLLEFKDNPRVRMSITGPKPNMDVLSGKGTIELGRTAMRGSWIDSAHSQVVIKDRAVLYKDFTVEKAGRRATGSFTYDFGRREVRLDGVQSALNPAEVLMWVDPRIAATVAVYRFRTPPDVKADGLVHMRDPEKNDLRIEVDAPDGLDYELLKRDLAFGATVARVNLKGRHVLANVSKAALMGGAVTVDADVSTDHANPVFGASVNVTGVDFPSLTKLYFGYSRSEGRMSGSYSFTARLRDSRSMKGEGSIRVEEGHVLAIPLFGPLSEIISTIIPGVGHESARLATADFTIADNEVSTKNLEIEGQGFEMFGEGDIGFPSGDLDLSVRINAKGIPGIVLFPVSKLFEYVSSGTMSDPQWRPKLVPKEFFDILGMGGNGRAKPKKPAVRR